MNNFRLQEKSLDTGNGKVFYYLDNSFPEKPIAVFLHGLSANHTTWLNPMRILHENGYNSLALDLRGHGLSDKTKKKSLYKIPVMTDDLRKIIAKERISRFVLIGYSFGGSIAMDYAVKYPESVAGLVLISASHRNPLIYKKINFLTPLGKALLNFLAILLLWQKRKKHCYYKHGASRGYWHSVWIGLNTMPLSVNFWLIIEAGTVDFSKTLKKISAPTIIIHSENDKFITAEEANEMAKILPHSRIIVSRNPSHFIASHSQKEIIEIILEFLKNYENSDF